MKLMKETKIIKILDDYVKKKKKNTILVGFPFFNKTYLKKKR